MTNFDTFARFNRPVELDWIPVIEDESSNQATTSEAIGESLRWGNHVWICFSLITTSIAGLTGTETLLIKDLPYSTALGATIHLTSLDNLVLTAGDSLPRGVIANASFPDAIAMQYLPNNNTTGDVVFPVNKWSATATVVGCGFYMTDD